MTICLGEPISLMHAFRQIYCCGKTLAHYMMFFFVVKVKYFVYYIVKCICHVLAHNVGTVSESAHERVVITWRIRDYGVSCILTQTFSL